MRFLVLKTTTVITKELYEVNIAGYLNPLSYIDNREPVSEVVERDVRADIFKVDKREVHNDTAIRKRNSRRCI